MVENITKDCFEIQTKIGEGAYGKVYLVTRKAN
jgi:serine/threonine protein kinase